MLRTGTLFLLTAWLALGQSPAARPREEAAIRSLVARYVDARDQIDAQAVAGLFTADADQLVSSGEWRKGRDSVVRGTMASSKASSGKRTIAVDSIRFVSGDVAIADGRYEIAASGSTPAHKMWTSIVTVRTADGWRIAAIRNMLPAPPAP